MSFNSDLDHPGQPDEKPAKGKTAARRKARSLAMQALYQWHLAGQSVNEIEAQFRVDNDFVGVDGAYFREILHGVLGFAAGFEAHQKLKQAPRIHRAQGAGLL